MVHEMMVVLIASFGAVVFPLLVGALMSIVFLIMDITKSKKD